MAHHYILLDKSGSMLSRWEETINSLNDYVSELPKSDKVTVTGFDTTSYETVRHKQMVSEFKQISKTELQPRAMTNLFDSVAKISDTILEKNAKKAVLLILTDGFENASKEFNKDTAKAKLDKLRERNYQVIFLGADFDNTKDRDSLGGNVTKGMTLSAGTYSSSMRGLAASATAYSSGTLNSIDTTKLEKI